MIIRRSTRCVRRSWKIKSGFRRSDEATTECGGEPQRYLTCRWPVPRIQAAVDASYCMSLPAITVQKKIREADWVPR
ncbi:hypothetical protein KCP78_17335 [Salmonella enterica subsp. enterica]|nr:hypothetical protein KCP78_17335 [Salmonella enterica subsp. enterica]